MFEFEKINNFPMLFAQHRNKPWFVIFFGRHNDHISVSPCWINCVCIWHWQSFSAIKTMLNIAHNQCVCNGIVTRVKRHLNRRLHITLVCSTLLVQLVLATVFEIWLLYSLDVSQVPTDFLMSMLAAFSRNRALALFNNKNSIMDWWQSRQQQQHSLVLLRENING